VLHFQQPSMRPAAAQSVSALSHKHHQAPAQRGTAQHGMARHSTAQSVACV
jgi:hypothetical protein